MSSGSLKDVVKLLNKTFAEPRVPLPLPDEIIHTIETYLESHSTIDDHDSQRLQDELLNVYQKYVPDALEKHGAFVNVLRHLRPVITGEKRLEEWWTLVIRPTIDAVGHKRDTIEDAREFLLGILVFDEDEDPTGEHARISAHFTQRLIDAYLARTRIPFSDGAVISPEDDFIAHELETVLVTFGRRKPKEFLLAVDNIFVRPQYRAQALGLLSSFVRLQPPHLHLVLQTPLIDHLHKCLLLDESSTVVDLAVTILIMFLPHITSSLVAHLPTLFLIYSRLLCWDELQMSFDSEKTEASSEKEELGQGGEEPATTETMNWKVLDQHFDNIESSNPRVDYLFTFLYGLFPLNLMAFIRKPRKYLKSVQYVGADELDLRQDMIRSRTEPHRRVHLVHPNFYLTTAEDELNDNRWVKSDAADIVTECLNLCSTVSASLNDPSPPGPPGPPPTGKLPPIPKSKPRRDIASFDPSPTTDDETTLNNDISPSDMRSNYSWRNTQSTALTSRSSQGLPDLPRLPRSSRASSSHGASRSSRGTSPGSRSRDLVPESPALRPQLPSHPSTEIPAIDVSKRSSASKDASTTSPRLESFAQALSAAQFPVPPARSPPPSLKVASLQRENMLLRNDLNFERYLKQQHLSHIGQLQRKHIREATVEAETQNLLNTNRTLKAKLTKASEQYAQLKRETTTSRSQSKKFESDLTLKVRSYREEEKQWQSEGENLRQECATLKKDCENLRRLLVESEQREFNMQNQMQMRNADLEELNTLKAEVENLQTKLHDFEIRELHFEKSEEDRDSLQSEVQSLKMMLNSKEAERERTRRSYEIKIKDLEAKLDSPRPGSQVAQGAQLPASVQQMLDSALAASQSRFNQLKKAHTKLLHKYTELEMHCQELEASSDVLGTPYISPHGSKGSHDFDPPSGSSNGLSPSSSVSRRPHAFSESLLAEVDEIFGENASQSSAGTQLPLQGAREPPSRFDSLSNRNQAMERAREKEAELAAGYERNLSGFLSYNPTAPLSSSSARSTGSGDSKGSGGTVIPKEKVGAKSDMRIYGRGGAQNIGKSKTGSKAGSSDPKTAKSGGFRGIRGIM
ncbi:hypothetical protein NA57DRAFT_52850 [Rhizodiscina lignyota]|uniref:Hamartin n=1 Tax=Rhizodiscina lignyota TaxID=1504668 RepID=A0A9P4IPJ9_9PEZI|nr:hypothetical protein NA57DRAFT_52850 [Rhizodiscina lignyota]